jgi:hypothetical protein
MPHSSDVEVAVRSNLPKTIGISMQGYAKCAYQWPEA